MNNSESAQNLGQQFVDKVNPRPSIDGERLIALFSQLVELLGHSLPLSSELVLHDLSKLPNSIVAIHGNVTGRKVGDSATYGLLAKISDITNDHAVDSLSTLPDGRQLRCSTMIIHDVSGFAVAALCINSDLSMWTSVQKAVNAMLGTFAGTRAGTDASLETSTGTDVGTDVSTDTSEVNAAEPRTLEAGATPYPQPEGFAKNVDELAEYLITNAIGAVGVPVDLMQKRHKLEVVRDLKVRGLFLFRDSVDMLAASLNVTRFTIYNYLNEISDKSNETNGTT